MKISTPFSRKTKRSRAIDTVASVTKIWSEWQLAKTAGKTAKKSIKSAKTAKKKAPWRRIALIGVAGGLAVAIAKRAKGSKEDASTYTYSPPTPPPTPKQSPPAAPSTPPTKAQGDPADDLPKASDEKDDTVLEKRFDVDAPNEGTPPNPEKLEKN